MTGISTNAHAMQSSADNSTLESIARNYLQSNAVTIAAQGQIPEIRLSNVTESPSFYVTRFTQTYNGLPVYNTTALVMITKDGLHAVDAVTKFKSFSTVVGSKIDAQTALSNAIAAIAPTIKPRGTPKTQEVLYAVEPPTIQLSNGGRLPSSEASTEPQVARVCWLINVPTLEPLGDWSILVDGPTGKVISKQNLIRNDSGEGWVYLYSNPIQTGGNLAWPAPDDADHDILTAQETTGLPNYPSVQLLHLASGTEQLVGDFVDLTAPGITCYYIGGVCYKSAGLADEPTQVYHYTRADDRFEETMVYYYVDSLHSYLQQIGELWLLNYPVPAYAHYYPDTNAFYDPSNGGLYFGDGTDTYPIDFAEDADVIIHEYGHAIHGDQGLFNGWVSEEMGAFSEGFSDYLAVSFLDQGAPGTAGCLGEWVGYGGSYPTGTYPYCTRNTFSTKHYPEDMTGEEHADGEMWSAALWQLRGLLGKTTTDRLAIESGYYLWPDAGFRDAVHAMIHVDRSAYAGAHESTIRQVFRDNGMLSYWIGSQAHPWGPWTGWQTDIPDDDRGFENGWGSWTPESSDPLVAPVIVDTAKFSGSYAAELKGSDGGLPTESSIYHEFDMPTDATWVNIRFRYRIDTSDYVQWDWLEVRVGTPSDYIYTWWLENTGGEFYWREIHFPTGDLRGQTCRLTFLLHDDGDPGYPTYVYLDGGGQSDIALWWSDFHALITVNGVTQDTPKPWWPTYNEMRVLDGTVVSISAPSPELRVGGLTYRFQEWNDRQLNPVHPSFTPSQDWYLEAEYYAGSWSGWERLPGGTLSAPTIVYDSYDGRVHMFVRGTDNGIYHNSWQSGIGNGWAGWEQLSGLTTNAQPAAVADSAGNLHVVAVGTDGHFYSTLQQPTGSPWGPWQQIVGENVLGASASLMATSAGRVDLVVRLSNSAIRHNWWVTSSGEWQGWDNPGGGTLERPVLAYDSSIDTLYSFVRGTDNRIYHNDLDLDTNLWSGWYYLAPGGTLAAPAVIADGGRVDLFVRGTDNGIYHGYRVHAESPSTVHWEQLPGGTLDTPAEAYRFSNVGSMLEVVVRGTDSGIYHNTLDVQTQTWSGWTQIPGATASTPGLLVNPDWNDEMYLYVRGSDNGIYFGSTIVWLGPPP
jgi:hypothetical protein